MDMMAAIGTILQPSLDEDIIESYLQIYLKDVSRRCVDRRNMFQDHHHWAAHFGRRAGARGGPFRGGRPDFFEMFGGPAPRPDRGGVRYLILDAIAQQPRHGYEIIQAIEERSARTYRPSPGVIYPTLQMLEELGHTRVEEHDARKVYAITADGKRDLAEHADEVRDFYADAGEGSWEDMGDDLRDLMQRVGRMFKSIGRAARHGRLNPSTMRKLRVVVNEAATKIEEIIDSER
jgi:DNA-binding PadR family transcriptional regulator